MGARPLGDQVERGRRTGQAARPPPRDRAACEERPVLGDYAV